MGRHTRLLELERLDTPGVAELVEHARLVLVDDLEQLRSEHRGRRRALPTRPLPGPRLRLLARLPLL